MAHHDPIYCLGIPALGHISLSVKQNLLIASGCCFAKPYPALAVQFSNIFKEAGGVGTQEELVVVEVEISFFKMGEAIPGDRIIGNIN